MACASCGLANEPDDEFCDARWLVEETSAWFTEGHDVADLRSAPELIAQLR